MASCFFIIIFLVLVCFSCVVHVVLDFVWQFRVQRAFNVAIMQSLRFLVTVADADE